MTGLLAETCWKKYYKYNNIVKLKRLCWLFIHFIHFVHIHIYFSERLFINTLRMAESDVPKHIGVGTDHTAVFTVSSFVSFYRRIF